ncbi:tetratricopeptide repeat protein [Saccharothrix sp. NRRL B-16348]|uniref:tetratricopeptide repeat protein n=1 Tax=Saccharothrix sp. NRRL B-16348 TaxID=1415542 RepID=UPI0018D19AE5|nr:tetratricopeptide repeat protein [Saccharothrix sp. NRRL B-16348]
MSNAILGVVAAPMVQAHTIEGGVHQHHHGTTRRVALPYRAGVVPPRAGAFQVRRVTFPVLGAVGRATGASTAVRVLSGLGGVGKTQLAIDHAERLWGAGKIDLLVWITAASRDAVVSEYARVAADLTGLDEPDSEVGARRLLEWLARTRSNWLVVLDDVCRPGDIDGLWPPPNPTGKVLVTTRRQDAALRGHDRQVVEVGVFTPEEAGMYLRSALVDQPQLLDHVDDLAKDLGYLPLALAQAAAYMLDRDLTCSAYEARWAARRRLAALLPDNEALPDGHRVTVAATWALSIEQANHLEPAGLAEPLLQAAAQMDANGIPIDIFASAAVTRWLSHTTGRSVTTDDTRDALNCLRRLSLVTLDPAEPHRAVRVHALVQRATRDNMPEDLHRTVTRTVAEALLEVWPAIEGDSVLSQVLRANTEALHHAAGVHLWHDGGHQVLFRAGQSLGNGGLVVQARDWYLRLHDAAARHLGPRHRAVFNARHNYATWRGEAGDPIGALAQFRALLADQGHVLGTDDPDTLVTRHNIAALLAENGGLHDAVREFETLLTDQARLLGPDHPDTLGTRGNLASWRGEAGEPHRAVAALRGVLRAKVRILGPDHLDTLATRSSLARWRREAGDPQGAVADLEAVLAGRQRVLGPDHPSTLATRGTLARWRTTTGSTPGDAVVELEQLLSEHIRALGPDHPYTLTARHNLAVWRGTAGDIAGAVADLTTVLADDTRVLGVDHPDTLLTRANLAHWRGRAGDVAEAVADLEAVLSERNRVLGPQHPDTLITRSNLVLLRSRLS